MGLRLKLRGQQVVFRFTDVLGACNNMAQADAVNENFGSHNATIHRNLHIVLWVDIDFFCFVLTFGVNISGMNRWTELCLFGETEAGGALLSGKSPADGLRSLYHQHGMRYGR